MKGFITNKEVQQDSVELLYLFTHYQLVLTVDLPDLQ